MSLGALTALLAPVLVRCTYVQFTPFLASALHRAQVQIPWPILWVREHLEMVETQVS